MENELDSHLSSPGKQIPNSIGVLVLGIVSIPTCVCLGVVGLACGIIALYLHKKAINIYYSHPDIYSESSLGLLKAGKICAIVGVSLSGLYFLYYLVMFGLYGFALFGALAA